MNVLLIQKLEAKAVEFLTRFSLCNVQIFGIIILTQAIKQNNQDNKITAIRIIKIIQIMYFQSYYK